jgi:hypothetical protein
LLEDDAEDLEIRMLVSEDGVLVAEHVETRNVVDLARATDAGVERLLGPARLILRFNQSCPGRRALLQAGQLQDSAKPGLVEAIPEPAHERCEARLAGAVAWRDPLQSERVVQHAGDSLDLLAGRQHEMESADRRVELPVDLRSGAEDVLDARVRAADNHRQAFRASDGQR